MAVNSCNVNRPPSLYVYRISNTVDYINCLCIANLHALNVFVGLAPFLISVLTTSQCPL